MGLILHTVLEAYFTEIIYNECDVTKTATQAFVDSKSLVQSVYSITLVSEKRLSVDLAAIQQIERPH